MNLAVLFTGLFLVGVLFGALIQQPTPTELLARAEFNITAQETIICQYSAGHNKLVYRYEAISDTEILTSDSDIFDVSVCVGVEK